jgi:hypothetical protein
MAPLSYDTFKSMARASKRAFHLEQRDTYNVTAEDEPFGKWQRGEPDDYAWHQDWLRFLREATVAGDWRCHSSTWRQARTCATCRAT